MFGKRKRRIVKPRKQQAIPKTSSEGITAREKSYLDQLEKMITSPGLTPYIRRNGPGRQAEESSAVAPMFDSGPLTADQMATTQSNAGTVQAPGSLRPSLVSGDGRVRLGADGVYEIAIDVPAADLEEDEDVRPPKPAKPAKPHRQPVVEVKSSRPSSDSPDEPPRVEEIAKSKDLFPCGTLVLWNGNHLGVYKKYLEQKGYDLVYVVEQDGRLHPKGICLFAYEPQRVGLLSDGIFQWMERTMRWERDALVFHFDNPNDVSKVSVLNERQSAERADAAPEHPENATDSETLVRGRTFTVSVGKHQWYGVYWGRDAIGTIVAHNTNHVWSLMHLDLDRFGASLKFSDVLPSQQIREIESVVNGES